MTKDISEFLDLRIRVYAEEHDMQKAENELFGFSYPRISHLDWEPMDDDDERPDNCERYIEVVIDGSEQSQFDFANMMRVAGYLAGKSYLQVFGRTIGIGFYFNSNGKKRIHIREQALNNAFTDRIEKAINLLKGNTQ